jgi:heme exporter protein D
MLAFICYALALTILISGAVKEHRRYQSREAQQEERDGVQEFDA